MGLKNVFNAMKSEGYIIKKLDTYLVQLADKDNDRRWDINSPSMASRCKRAIVYSRLNYDRDFASTDAKLRRIFDNGTCVHERLQGYLEDEGMLLMSEVPIYNSELQIQGHTDGILQLNAKELGVLEIKSINSYAFESLVDAKPEHKVQAQIYLACLESERENIRKRCKTYKDLCLYIRSKEFREKYSAMYDHLKDGAKFTREEKINFKLEQHRQACKLLWKTSVPISKIVFLYENKDNQQLKEFVVVRDKNLLQQLSEKLTEVNECCAKGTLPDREGTSKSCTTCRWCDFTDECWVV